MSLLISDNPIKLRLRCDKPILHHLFESPLSCDQQLTELNERQFELNATLADTQDLRWWLTAQASHLDILEPEWLREEISNELSKALTRAANHEWVSSPM